MRASLGFTSNNRPEYLRPVLESWRAAIGFAGQWPDPVVVRHEPGEHADRCRGLVKEILPGADQVTNSHQLGPLVNPKVVLSVLTERRDPAALVMLAEDDAVVSVDALAVLGAMFEFAAVTDGWDLDRTFFCLNHRHGPDLLANDATLIGEGTFSPTVWAVTPAMFETYLADTWDCDYSHKGWDWHFTDTVIPVNGLRVMIPALSRSTHIGRLGGSHTTESTWPESIAPTFSLGYRHRDFTFHEG